tara:strand:- start:635 stop:1552 length:918 start_codon:yes stop_codon:yes gene_type:complete
MIQRNLMALMLAAMCLPVVAADKTLFAANSKYNYITVVDRGSFRILSFNGSQESRMSNYRGKGHMGHFEYTEFLQMPLVWKPNAKRVLMIGLGGGSTQKAYRLYYPDIHVDVAEIDPMVVQVAARFFGVREGPGLKMNVGDGRRFLKQNKEKYDIILLDAYTSTRKGSNIPYHLATKEFFQLTSDNLTADGVLAYNVIGTYGGWRADNVGSLYKTIKSAFPHVYHFPATESKNIVYVAPKEKAALTTQSLRTKYTALLKQRPQLSPNFLKRIQVIRNQPPVSAANSPVLLDAYTPASGMLGSRSR